MVKRNFISFPLIYFLIFSHLPLSGWTQEAKDSVPHVPKNYTISAVPIIGFGTGLLSYLGDIKSDEKVLSFPNRIGYQFLLSTHLTTYIDMGLSGLTGTVGGSQNKNGLNLNFKTKISSGGIYFLYNFDHFLNQKRKITPLISLGIEVLDYRSKGDLATEINDTMLNYYYWNDGTIHDVSQSSGSSGKMLTRDKIFETDLRDANMDGFGRYSQTAFSIPAGAGIRFNVTNRLHIDLIQTFHFTFTDLMDNVSGKSTGIRKGNNGKDMILFTAVKINYDLLEPKLPELPPPTDSSLLASLQDEDHDSVIDKKDLCPGTPSGVKVDSTGCPLDSDKDGVPDYIDKEPNTPFGAFVDEWGVQLSDSAKLNYLKYYDTLSKQPVTPADTTPSFRVQLAAFPRGKNPSPEEIDKLLSFEGVVYETTHDGTIVYMAGNFATPEEAEVKRQELLEKGILTDLQLIQWIPVYLTNIVPDSAKVASLLEKSKAKKDSAKVHEDVLFRVQLGAFRYRPTQNIFARVQDIVAFKGDDGLTRFYSGEFPNNYDEADIHKQAMLAQGFKGAFVVVYKGGKRVPLGSFGTAFPVNTVTEKKVKQNGTDAQKTPMNVSKNEISFKVQIGAFKQTVPVEIIEKYNKIKDVKKYTNDEGMTIYSAGSFPDLQHAIDYREKIANVYGIKDSFVVAFRGEQQISLKDALRLLKEMK